MKSQFPPLKSLKLLADVLIDSIQRETIQKLYKSIQRRLEAVLEENGGKTPS